MTTGDWDRRRTSFGALAEGYEAVRPGWPEGAARWLTGTDDVGRQLRVLDLGAGTGKLTATLVALGHDVVAVDPSAGMLDVLRRRVPQAQVHRATAERLPLPDRDVDAVTVAQAWHWFDAEAAAAECARVLRPGGTLGIAWHLRDAEVEWVGEVDAIAGRPEAAAADALLRATGPHALPGFGPVQTLVSGYELPLTADGLVELAASWSYVAVRPDRDDVLAALRSLGRRVAGPDGRLVLPYVTRGYRAVRS